MASSNNARSFTNLGTSATTEQKSSGINLNSGLGSARNPWGVSSMGGSSIWSDSSLTNGFPSRATTRDNSRSRDGMQHTSAGEGETTSGETGSGSLIDSSVPDNWNYRTPWGGKSSLPNGRTAFQVRNSDTSTLQQQRSVSNAGLPHSNSTATNTLSSFGSRPPTINLNSTSLAQPGHAHVPPFTSGRAARGSEPPPIVYTKFDRPADPNGRKLPDSAKGGLWSDMSPTDDRKHAVPMQYSVVTGSVPSSRNNSQPPSRHAHEQPSFTSPDYSRSSQRSTQNNSRAPSLSSQGLGQYNYTRDSNADPLVSQFSGLSINGDSRSSTSFRPLNDSSAMPGQAANFSGTSSFSKYSQSSFSRDLNGSDEVDDIDSSSISYLGLNGYASPHPSQGYPNFAAPPSRNAISQTPVAQPYANGHVPNHSFEIPGGPRSASDWQSFNNGSTAMNQRTSGLPDQSTYLDPRMQQLLATQLRTPYGPMYGPYAFPNAMQLGATAPYGPLLPVGLAGIDPAAVGTDPPTGETVQSALMYEFKSNTKSKRYELKDIYEHIAEFSGDQHGSRFIQTKLETANSDEKERVFREIQPNAIQLMTDVFGNYVIQKFFEHGDQIHKKVLANKMRGQVLTLSMQMYGCRVVQKALDHVLVDQQASLIGELEGHVLKCVKDQNGNHVIQKAIERCPPSTIGFILAAFQGQVSHLSTHAYGCRVIQRCLERCDPPAKHMVMAELMDGIQGMIADQYGNYVVQHVVEHDDGDGRRTVLAIVARGLESYSKHKFASNVVEKCLEKADDAWKRQVVLTLASGEQRRCDGEGILVGLIKDNFGNYVIQKLLDTLAPDDYVQFLDYLQPAMAHAKRSGCGKQVLSIEKRMHKYTPYRHNSVSGGLYNSGMYQMPLAPPPFASNFNSAATTPPPLTADTQSLQSSGIPSINGDAVEGAAIGSRKGSEPSTDNNLYLR